MNVATATMVLITVLMTVFAGPIYEIADAASENLMDPTQYVATVDEIEGSKP